MRVLYLSNIPSPYRMNFFDELAMHCTLTVIFEAETAGQLHPTWFSESSTKFKSIFLNKGPINEKKACVNALSYLNKNCFDIIVVTNYSTPTGMLAITSMRFRGIPFVLEVDGGLPKNGIGIRERIKKFLISSASLWLSTGKITDGYLIQYGAKYDRLFRYPFTTLYSREIQTQIISEDQKVIIRKNLGIKEGQVALTVGQLIHRKGIDILLEAWRKMPKDYGLYVIGDGVEKEYLKKKAKSYGLTQVSFVPFKNKQELLYYYRSADVFVLPTREDIWGLVINEAMACGLPIITTDKCIAGLELIEEGVNGYVVPVESSELLYAHSFELLSDNVLRKRMAHKSLEKIKDYSIENMAKTHIEIFEMYAKEERRNENPSNKYSL